MTRKFIPYLLPILFLIISESALSQLYILSSGSRGTDVISLGAVKNVSDLETAVGFDMISVQHISKDDEPLFVVRNQLVALCNIKDKRLGDGQIISRTWSSASAQVNGEKERMVHNETYSPPQFVEKSFGKAYLAANLACSKANY